MGREFIGECSPSGEGPEADSRERELAIKYIKRECGAPPDGVDVQVTWEGYERGDGSEISYPVISVVWDDGVSPYPDEYIGKCTAAFERFDLPAEVHELHEERRSVLDDLQGMFNRIEQHVIKRRHIGPKNSAT